MTRRTRQGAQVGVPVARFTGSGRAWMLAVTVAAAAAAGRQIVITPAQGRDVLLAAALVGCAGICQEAARRQGLPDGVTRDLLTVWCLPAALLLPPLYALCAPALAVGVYQLGARHGPALEQTFRAATLGLAGGAGSVLFRALGAAGHQRWFAHPVTLAAAVASAGLFVVVSVTLAAVAAHAADPVAGWREAAWNHEHLLLDLAGLCVGILVTIACAVSPALLAVALPPVMLLQRSLPHQQLRVAARADPKTGLLHAAAWQREADTRIRAAQRAGTPVALLLVDIDHFKRVNDLHGHLAGDDVLRAIAAALRQQLGDSDVLGRYGGEEFVVLVPGAEPAGACAVAERLRERVGAQTVHTGDGRLNVTVSVGVAVLPGHGGELFELLASADLALYRAKRLGRNRVCLASSGPCPSDPRAGYPYP
jgi:diguanylate cyclase (GGDEF)-like protein